MSNPLDYLHPHAIDAERALLGGLIQRPERLQELAQLVSPDDFWDPRHRRLLELIVAMHGEGVAVDMVTLPERVLRHGTPMDFGGVAYVIELPEHAPSTANLDHYARVVREKATLRLLMDTGSELVATAAQHPENVSELVNRVTTTLVTLGTRGNEGQWVPVSVVVDEAMVRLQSMEGQDAGGLGVTSGFASLDKKTAGFQKGDLVILAARPSMGKTALALNLALNAALASLSPDGDAPATLAVGVYSLEMSRQQLVDRLLCSIGKVDAGKLRTGTLTAEDWEKLLVASDLLRRLKISINDRPGLTIGEVRAHALRLKSELPELGLVVLDYLQLMGAADPRQSRVQQVSEMSRGLKALAKDLDVPVIALSQLSRGVESRADKRPMMSDLRESGAIEQDADVILFIYRDEYYNEGSEDAGMAEVIIAKQRNGPTGMVKLAFQKQYTLFTEPAEKDWFLH